MGVPFDAGTSFRPGARFGPAHIHESSRLLRPYNPAQDVSPFAQQQVIDAGDLVANPFDIAEALTQIEAGARELLERAERLVVLLSDPDLRGRLGAAGRAWVERHWRWDVLADRLRGLLDA